MATMTIFFLNPFLDTVESDLKVQILLMMVKAS